MLVGYTAGGKPQRALKELLAGFWSGLRVRQPVRSVVSRAYRRNFHAFAGPWPFTRSLPERISALGGDGDISTQRQDRTAAYYGQRTAFYPTGRASLTL